MHCKHSDSVGDMNNQLVWDELFLYCIINFFFHNFNNFFICPFSFAHTLLAFCMCINFKFAKYFFLILQDIIIQPGDQVEERFKETNESWNPDSAVYLTQEAIYYRPITNTDICGWWPRGHYIGGSWPEKEYSIQIHSTFVVHYITVNWGEFGHLHD